VLRSADPTVTAKPKKFDPVRERIARRAALEFKNGMYGKLFSISLVIIISIAFCAENKKKFLNKLKK
jgi:hypothetical protein